MKTTSSLLNLGISLLILFFAHNVNGQTQDIKDVNGIVYELTSSQRLKDVKVKNLRTKAETTTDSQGNFTIEGKLNDYLTFTQIGYTTDTAFIYQGGVQRIYMVRDNKSIVIDEVVVSRLTDSRLMAEIARAKNEGTATEASQNRGGLRISPSRLFGKDGKLARKNLALLETEQNNRKIDRLFTDQTILTLVPLNDEELPLFRERFRPTLNFIQTASPVDVRAYILESYSKFKSKQTK